jgi:hypothetical protein
MLSENEHGFVNVCGTSTVQANNEAGEVADEFDRMIEGSIVYRRSRTYGHLSFFQETVATFAACPSIGCGALSIREIQGSERKRKKCYKI